MTASISRVAPGLRIGRGLEQAQVEGPHAGGIRCARSPDRARIGTITHHPYLCPALVAPGLRIGRGLERLVVLDHDQDPLRLRPVSGSGEDWNYYTVLYPLDKLGVAPGLRIGRGLELGHPRCNESPYGVAPGLRIGRGLEPRPLADTVVPPTVAPGLRIGRGLEHAAPFEQPSNSHSCARSPDRARIGTGDRRPCYLSPVCCARSPDRARIGTSVARLRRSEVSVLRPVSGSGEDWNSCSSFSGSANVCCARSPDRARIGTVTFWVIVRWHGGCARSPDRARIGTLWILGVTVPVLVGRSGTAVQIFPVKVVSI